MVSKNIKNFELRLKRTGVIVIIVGMAALLCITFLLGVEVGKSMDTYPEKISSLPGKIFALVSKPAKIDPEQSLDNKNDSKKAEDKNIDLTFYKTLTSKKVTEEKRIPAKEKNVVEKSAAGENKKIISEKSTSAAELKEISKQTEIVETKKKKTEKSSETADKIAQDKIVEKKYIIHAASFREIEKAYLLNKKIAELKFKPIIIPVEIKNKGKWYRVIVPGFKNKDEAQSAADKISKETATDCIIRTVDVSKDK